MKSSLIILEIDSFYSTKMNANNVVTLTAPHLVSTRPDLIRD